MAAALCISVDLILRTLCFCLYVNSISIRPLGWIQTEVMLSFSFEGRLKAQGAA